MKFDLGFGSGVQSVEIPDAMLEEQPEEADEEPQEEQPEKTRRRFWPFGRKRDEK